MPTAFDEHPEVDIGDRLLAVRFETGVVEHLHPRMPAYDDGPIDPARAGTGEPGV